MGHSLIYVIHTVSLFCSFDLPYYVPNHGTALKIYYGFIICAIRIVCNIYWHAAFGKGVIFFPGGVKTATAALHLNRKLVMKKKPSRRRRREGRRTKRARGQAEEQEKTPFSTWAAEGDLISPFAPTPQPERNLSLNKAFLLRARPAWPSSLHFDMRMRYGCMDVLEQATMMPCRLHFFLPTSRYARSSGTFKFSFCLRWRMGRSLLTALLVWWR